MVNKITVRERIILLLVIALFGILGGMISFMAATNFNFRNDNSVITQKITEKQVYLENSQTIQAIKNVSNSLVTVVDESKRATFLGLGDTFKTACFSMNSADCGLSGVILTSDGIVVSVSQEKDLKGRKLLAFDNNGGEFAAKLLSRDESNGLIFLQLYKLGEEVVPAQDRLKNYSFTAISFADLKNISVGQQILVLRGNIFNGLANLQQTVIASLLRADQITNWPVAFSSEEQLTAIGFADDVGAEGNAVTDLNGGLVGVAGVNENFIDVETLSNNLNKYKKNHLAELPQMFFGLKLIRNSKQMAQNSGLTVDYGYVVATVKAGVLGQKLGLKEKDLILEIDGTSLLYENPWNLLGLKIAGDEITMKVLRGKDMLDLKTKL